MTENLSHHDLCQLVARLQAERAELRDRLTRAVMNIGNGRLRAYSVDGWKAYETGIADAKHQAVEKILEILGEG